MCIHWTIRNNLFRTVPQKLWSLIARWQSQSTCQKHDWSIMDLIRITLSTRALQDAQNSKAAPTKSKGDHFTTKPKVCLLRNFCQGQDECRSFIFFLWNRPPWQKFHNKLMGRLAGKNGRVGSSFNEKWTDKNFGLSMHPINLGTGKNIY
jgi:hypothetical protein